MAIARTIAANPVGRIVSWQLTILLSCRSLSKKRRMFFMNPLIHHGASPNFVVRFLGHSYPFFPLYRGGANIRGGWPYNM